MATAPVSKEPAMAFEPSPHDNFQTDHNLSSPPNGTSGQPSNLTSPLGRVHSPNALQSLQNTLLSPNSQAVFSETTRSSSDHYRPLPGNSPTFWYDLLSKFRQHMDNERLLQQQEMEGLRNEIRALQSQVQTLRGESTRSGSQRGLANGNHNDPRSFFPDENTVRRSRESLDRIRQPNIDINRSRSVSPGRIPPPPPSIASLHGLPGRLASIDEHVTGAEPPDQRLGSLDLAANGHGCLPCSNTSPFDAQTPRSPPATAIGAPGAPAQTPMLSRATSHPNQRLRRTSESQHPETIAAVSRAVNAMGIERRSELLDGVADGDEPEPGLPDDPRLTGQLSLPHNPSGPNSRKSEEFLAAMWSKVKDDTQPAVLRAIEAEEGASLAEKATEVLDPDEVEEMPEGPVLRTRQSTNFGAPLGSLGGLGRR